MALPGSLLLVFLGGSIASSISLSTTPFKLSSALEQDFHAMIEKDVLLVNNEDGRFLRRSDGMIRRDYSTTGFVCTSLHVSPDKTCDEPALTYGEAVNQCFKRGSFSYKFQIRDDDCNGAVIEYFSDQNCETYLGAKDISDAHGRCEESTLLPELYLGYRVHQSLQCSTSASPVVPQRAFSEPQCDGMGAVYQRMGAAFAPCTYSASIGYYTADTCSNSAAVEFTFQATDCAGQDTELTALCYRGSLDEDDDDDAFTTDDIYSTRSGYTKGDRPGAEEGLDDWRNDDIYRDYDEIGGELKGLNSPPPGLALGPRDDDDLGPEVDDAALGNYDLTGISDDDIFQSPEGYPAPQEASEFDKQDRANAFWAQAVLSQPCVREEFTTAAGAGARGGNGDKATDRGGEGDAAYGDWAVLKTHRGPMLGHTEYLAQKYTGKTRRDLRNLQSGAVWQDQQSGEQEGVVGGDSLETVEQEEWEKDRPMPTYFLGFCASPVAEQEVGSDGPHRRLQALSSSVRPSEAVGDAMLSRFGADLSLCLAAGGVLALLAVVVAVAAAMYRASRVMTCDKGVILEAANGPLTV